MQEFSQWDGFEGRRWKEGVNVRDFIQNNYTPYEGDESFLEGATEATDKLWGRITGVTEGMSVKRRRSRYGDRSSIFLNRLWSRLH